MRILILRILLKKTFPIIISNTLHYWIKYKTRINVLIFPLIFLLLTNCSSQPEKLLPYKLTFNASHNINNSAPLKIHIIFLTTKEKFMSANFFNLQNNIKNILGDKLIYEEQFFITPDKYHYNLSEKNQPKANYIGVIAEYMQLDDKYWRISFPIPTPEHIPFYKFWRSKPDALQVCIKVTGNGLNPDLNCAEGAE